MSTVLKGKPTADALDLDTTARVEALKAKGVAPCLAILRVGEREDDLAYERGALKRAVAFGSGACLTPGTNPPIPDDVQRLMKEMN